jgi:ankyrin repeat protein
MAGKSKSGFLHDDSRLHKLCQDGNYRKVTEFVNAVPDAKALEDRLSNRKGVFGYTPLHEAVASGHHKVLDFLLQRAGDGHVNCRANSGYTPLHLAASSGHSECVRVLLRHSADISVTDEYGKTPKQTAELSSKSSIVRILRSAEIIKEVETNGDGLTELLRFNTDQLEPHCLNTALTAAVRNDNHYNVGKLIVKGADEIKKALRQSVEEKKPNARAMLLLVHAAMEGNRNLVLRLFGEPTFGADNSRDYIDDTFPDVQKAVLDGKVSTVVPIEIARRYGHAAVREELLLKTDVNEQEKSVHWHGLRLLVLDINWLRKIHWVQKLRLARNGFKHLPNEMGTYLKQVSFECEAPLHCPLDSFC